MEKLKRFFKKDKRFLRISAIVLFVMVVALVAVCIGFYQMLFDSVNVETNNYLAEMSLQTSANIGRVISDNEKRTLSLSGVIKTAKLTDAEQLKTLLNEQCADWGYDEIMLATADGKKLFRSSKDTDQMVDIRDGSPLKTLNAEKKKVVFIDNIFGGGERIHFARVINNLTVGESTFGILVAAYPLETFRTVLGNDLFGGEAYAHIVDTYGTILISGAKTNVDGWGANFVTSLENGVSGGSDVIAPLKNGIAESLSGVISCNFNGSKRYISYRSVPDTEGWQLLTVVPVSALNQKSNTLTQLTMAFCLVIVIAFVLLLAFLMICFYRFRKKMEKLAFVDPVTGGMTLQKFYIDAESVITKIPNKHAVVYTNIEKFKVTNEQFGMETGNSLIQSVSEGISNSLSVNERVGRIMADHLCVLLNFESEEKLVERFYQWHGAILKELERRNISLFFPTLQLGVYVVGEEEMPMAFMLDRAKLAMNEKANILNNKMSYSLYNEREHIRLLREKQLEDCMDKALSGGEFEVYLQPKYSAISKEIGGAEALTRWSGHIYGMVYPDEFIPLFEKNGFIIQLDLWVFEQVCKLIRRWIDEGKQPIPISVNCSRRNLKTPHFIDNYIKILNRYDIPAKYIEIELTESIMYEDTEALVEMLEELHKIGFSCSIDDFGSGYSSLSMIQGIPVDVLKLDKIFFRNFFTDNERALSVIEAIISMAKSLSMKTVAEGVELSAQVAMLEKSGCDFIQGFIFAKPIPIVDFEKLAYSDGIKQK